MIQFNPSITIGNQKWKGGIPIFIIKIETKIILIIEFILCNKFVFNNDKKIKKNNKILDAKACVKKYFKAASDEYKLFIFIIKGINDKRLISKPIHTLNHEAEQILMIVPKNNVNKNNIL